MQATANEQTIRNIVQEVLTQLTARTGGAAASNGSTGQILAGVSSTPSMKPSLPLRRVLKNSAEPHWKTARKPSASSSRSATNRLRNSVSWSSKKPKIGRLEHKIAKLKAIKDVPGVEFLRTDAISGSHGLMITEYAPFGVIGAITPVTHSLPTLAGNFVNMVAAGNTIVCNPHPSGAKIASEGVRRFNKAIFAATGLENLVNIIGTPTIETAQQVFDHRGVKMLVVTGGPAVARAALQSPKRAIVAGPGNPPVVVDATADIDNAAKSIVAGRPSTIVCCASARKKFSRSKKSSTH